MLFRSYRIFEFQRFTLEERMKDGGLAFGVRLSAEMHLKNGILHHGLSLQNG